MRSRTFTLLLVTALVAACGDREDAEEAPGAADTTETASEGAPGGGAAAEEAAATTIGGAPTAASTAEAIGAPEPPGGYAVDSRPADGAMLAKIEYASPKTVPEAAEFYDTQMGAARRVQLEVAGDDIVVYGLSPQTTVGAATTWTDLQRLLDQRSEPILVISPWTMQRNDPLIADLRGIGQTTQADALLMTRSKVTIIYAVR
jgi:hypothetical protein